MSIKSTAVIQGNFDLCSIEEDIICSCYGLGIVKSVDVEERVFYIETSVNPNDMAYVNLFMVGDTSIPVDILQHQARQFFYFSEIETFYL